MLVLSLATPSFWSQRICSRPMDIFPFQMFHSCQSRPSPSPQAAWLKGNTLSQINQITSLQLASWRFLWSHGLVFGCKTNAEQSSTALPAFLTWCRAARGPWKRPCPGAQGLAPPPAQSHTGGHCPWAHPPGSAEKKKTKGEVNVLATFLLPW